MLQDFPTKDKERKECLSFNWEERCGIDIPRDFCFPVEEKVGIEGYLRSLVRMVHNRILMAAWVGSTFD
jgi:hypothetical protein